jgi:cyclic-di-AMP phosphodiesterase PgpH
MTLQRESKRRVRLRRIFSRYTLHAVLAGVFLVVGCSAILASQFLPFNRVELELDAVAPTDIRAPLQITYDSSVATEEQRKRAVAAVADVYDLPDADIAKAQIKRASQIFDYLFAVRADVYGTPDQKQAWIKAIPDLTLSDEDISEILALSDQDASNVQRETLAVLDDAMRDEIRGYQLISARSRLYARLPLEIPNNERDLVLVIAEDLIKPNTFVNEARTVEERERVSAAVVPERVVYEEGQIVIRAGEVVRPRHLEALEAVGLLQPEIDWSQIISTASLVLLLTLLLAAYTFRFARHVYRQPSLLWLAAILTVVFVGVARVLVPGHVVLPYALPLAALPIIIAGMIDTQIGVFIALVMSLFVGSLAGGSFELIVLPLAAGLVGVMTLGRHERINSLLWSGVYVALSNVAVILIFRLNGETDLLGLVTLVGAGLFSGVLAAGLALVAFFVLGNLTGITTSIQLFDLSRPTHPLLTELLRRAPGTYHHSLMLSNMGEQAAERIGANALLTRVGAYYHDIGKTVRPYFFVENTTHGLNNVHDKLDPQTSAQIIISHVKDGLDLAKKHRLPPVIRAFIAEHHATGTTKFFYHRAIEEAGGDASKVNEADFRYSGPNPQSRETAILMLADATEAIVRSLRPSSSEEIDQIVRKLIADKIASGELSECGLTLNDLEQIRLAFVGVLQGVFHPRIKYPEQIKKDGFAAAGQTEAPGKKTPSAAKTGPAPPAASPAPSSTTQAPLPEQERK